MTPDPRQGESAPVTLASAAEQLGVHYMTAYRYVRTGRMPAEKRSGKWWVTTESLAAVLAEGTGRRTATTGAPRELLMGPFTDRLIAGDTAGCWDIISDALAAGADPAQVHLELLGKALAKVGDDWAEGTVSVADEHRATATAMRLIGQLGPQFRHRGRRRGTIVLGAASGDPHALPSAILSDLLCDRRFDVIDLGANTPSESFVDAARSCDDLIGVGMAVTLDELLEAAQLQAVAIRAALPDTVFVVGGSAIDRCGGAGFAGVVDTVSSDALQICDVFEQAVSPDMVL